MTTNSAMAPIEPRTVAQVQTPVASDEPRAARGGSAASAMDRLGLAVRGGVDVEGARDDVALVDLGAREFAHDPAAVHHGDPVAAADQLLVVGAVEQDAGAGVGELAQEAVDLLLRADIDAAGRIVEEDDARLASSATWR